MADQAQAAKAPAARPCATPGCNHLDVLHDLARDRQTRTACSHSEGPKATPCPCDRFTPKED